MFFVVASVNHLKVDLLNGTVTDSTLLPGAGRLPVYGLNPNTYLDLAVDELGLWVIHADPEYGGNLIITKLDKGRACLATHAQQRVTSVSDGKQQVSD